MILAELEAFHSRNYSPTRRLALGYTDLPADPPPGFGPLLLGGSSRSVRRSSTTRTSTRCSY